MTSPPSSEPAPQAIAAGLTDSLPRILSVFGDSIDRVSIGNTLIEMAQLIDADMAACAREPHLRALGLAVEQQARTRADLAHARRIVTQLLRYSQATGAVLEPAPLDLIPLFLDAAIALRPATPAVVVEHPESCIVGADPALMTILIQALVENAISSAMQRAEIRIVLGVQPGCSFYVRDNGCGFEPHRAASIFMPFRMLLAIPAIDGAGLGLATVALIVARHAGRIRAHGEPDWGATVYVELPPHA